MAAPAASKPLDTKPLVIICNRCLSHVGEDLEGTPASVMLATARRSLTSLAKCDCNAVFGPLAKKCSPCASVKHDCNATDQPLVPQLNVVVRARAALARIVANGGPKDKHLGTVLREPKVLTGQLAAIDRNRNKQTSDKAKSRSARKHNAAATFGGGSSKQQVLELQGPCRGIMAMLEVVKVFVRLAGAPPATLDAMIAALGPDGAPDEQPPSTPGASERLSPADRKPCRCGAD